VVVSVVSDVTFHEMKNHISVEGFRRRSFVDWVFLCSCLMVLSLNCRDYAKSAGS